MDYHSIIDKFRGRSILVIGDLILDNYIWGRVSRISPEAPVPVVEVTKESFMLGGAANVAHNIISLGAKAAVVGITGKDSAGDSILKMLVEKGVDCGGVFEADRPTTSKTRIIAHNQQVVRFDREDAEYIDAKTLRMIVEYVCDVSSRYDAIIISDYKKGMVSSELVKSILKAGKLDKAAKDGRFVAVDPKIGHFDFYKGVSLITPNLLEASAGANVEIKDEKTLIRAGRILMKRLGARAVLITRGENGMSLFEAKKVSHIPTVARKVYDVTGAGDTVISAFTLAHLCGATMEESAAVANHAAGIVVGELGTAVATPSGLKESFGGGREIHHARRGESR